MNSVKIFLIIATSMLLIFSSCTKSVVTPTPVPPDTVVIAIDTTHHDTTTHTTTDTTDDNNMLMGNLSAATADTANPNNYLMVKQYYTVCYNRDRGTPNWVCWHIQLSDLGSTTRQDDFRTDATLPTNWYRPDENSYSSSGFDRGHNCPSADRTQSVAANSSTFLMSNMMPQAPYNNQQTWAVLEDSTRQLVENGNEVFVICGSYGTGGTGSKGTFSTIDNGRITVPSNIWKVVVVLPNGAHDLGRVDAATRVIAVNTPNINTTNRDWKVYRTSVHDIETATGYNLLSSVSATIQQALESKIDNL